MSCLRLVAFALAAFVLPFELSAQDVRQGRGGPTEAQAEPVALVGVPDWLKTYAFKHDTFTFVRIKYNSAEQDAAAEERPVAGGRVVRRAFAPGGGRWATDFPDSDLALCRQVEALTTLEAEAIFLTLTDPTLSKYPFLYVCEAGGLRLTDEEVAALRSHLLGGGLLMLDDFWGNAAYLNVRAELLRVFPDREPVELPLDHEIFHCVFDLHEAPQVPSIATALEGRDRGITWEEHHGRGSREVHYRAIADDDGRIMVLLCHNTDLSDGWERAGVEPWYTAEFSAKRAFPMGMNIVFYALTRP